MSVILAGFGFSSPPRRKRTIEEGCFLPHKEFWTDLWNGRGIDLFRLLKIRGGDGGGSFGAGAGTEVYGGGSLVSDEL